MNEDRFNEAFQIYEYTERELRTRRKGRRTKEKRRAKSVNAPELMVVHLENSKRFTLRGLMKRRFDYGYWDHMIFYTYPKEVGLAGFPVKLALFLGLGIMSIFYGLGPIPLTLAYIIWIVYRLKPHRRSATSYCLQKFKTLWEKVSALTIIILLFSLEVLAKELGRTYGLLDSIRRIRNRNVRSI